jgi:hypothetical protein
MMLARYRATLFESDEPLEAIRNAMTALDTLKPAHLYKYRPVDTYRRWADILIEGDLYCQHPEQFNDSFEGVHFLDSDALAIEYLSATHMIPGGDIARRRAIAELPTFTSSGTWRNFIQSALRLPQDIVVACLAATATSQLMWSHYADSGKGIAIEYDTKAIHSSLPGSLYKVISEETCPTLNKHFEFRQSEYFPYERTPNVRRLGVPHSRYLFKSSVWEYEQEWRIFQNAPSPFGLALGQAQTGVYLGSRFSDEGVRREIYEWCASRELALWEFHTNKSYRLDPVPMNKWAIDRTSKNARKWDRYLAISRAYKHPGD